MTSVRFSVPFLQKNCSFWFGLGFTKLTAVLVFFGTVRPTFVC